MVPLDRLFSTHIYARKEKPFLHLLNELETPYGILSVASLYSSLSVEVAPTVMVFVRRDWETRRGLLTNHHQQRTGQLVNGRCYFLERLIHYDGEFLDGCVAFTSDLCSNAWTNRDPSPCEML